ncbi:MAG: hypothetical protein ABI679_02800 [Gemmatimonadota bacterium]
MSKENKGRDQQSSNHLTTREIPQQGGEILSDQEKARFSTQRAEVDEKGTEPSGPGEDAEIARAMGHTAARKGSKQHTNRK